MEKMKENDLLKFALEALRKNLPGQAEIKTVNLLAIQGFVQITYCG